MDISEKYMRRCIELALLGMGNVAPNPMVGCVIVHRKKIIGEGFHQQYGGPHAEVNAVKAVSDEQLLKESTLYVSLEPCAHFGLTPPCTNLIIEKQIPRVVIGTTDPFAKVAGKGIEKLRQAGIEVTVGILEKECRELNKRFFTYHEKQRPYVILKWAQTADGYIDLKRKEEDYGTPTWITGDLALRLVHKIRSEEGAILVGTNTALKDNPSLTVRHWTNNVPVRVVIDRSLRLPGTLNLFDGSAKTLIFNSVKEQTQGMNTWVKIGFGKDVTRQILDNLYRQKILSVIVEGGKQLIDSFIRDNLWDEMHVFSGNTFFADGVRAPGVSGTKAAEERLDSDLLQVYRRI